MYHLSAFNKIWKSNYSDGYLLYNSMSHTKLRLSADGKTRLLNCQFDTFSEEILTVLRAGYIILDEGVTNGDIYKFKISNIVANKDTLGIFVIPNQTCNLACTYCQQSNLFDHHENTQMTREVIDGCYEWLNYYLRLWRSRELNIVFYGGEPLLTNKNILKYLFNKFSKLPVIPKYLVITNGTTLFENKEFFDYFNDVQVTIDGGASIHDHRRPFKDGSGSYELIISNVKKYANSIIDPSTHQLTIRFNVDKDNRDTLVRNIAKITKKLPMDRVSVSLNIIDTYEKYGNMNDFHGDIADTAKTICDGHEFLLREYGIRPRVWRINCGVSSLVQWVFDSDGSIYKCPVYTGNPTSAVSTVWDRTFNKRFYAAVNRRADLKCMECCYLGICYGGCMYQQDIRGKKDCKKRFFDVYIPRMVELEQLYFDSRKSRTLQKVN